MPAPAEQLVAELRIPAGWEESVQWLAEEAGFGPVLAQWSFPAGALAADARLDGRAADCLTLITAPERAAELHVLVANWAAAFGWAEDAWSLRTELRVVDDDPQAWQARWRPFRCAGFEVLAPFHDAAALPHRPGCTRLLLEPGSAFGTGAHPTTRLGLAALRRWVDEEPPAALLDVGTGSGILAVAAAVLGVPRVRGMDPDAASAPQAARMAARNGVAGACRFWQGTLASSAGRWPAVVANLVADLNPAPGADRAADLHQALVGDLAALLAPDGRLYLGGIAAARQDPVLAACERCNLRVERASGRGRWRGLELRRRRTTGEATNSVF